MEVHPGRSIVADTQEDLVAGRCEETERSLRFGSSYLPVAKQFLEKANRENNEAALAVLLLNVVAIVWGTQVSPSIDPYHQHPCS